MTQMQSSETSTEMVDTYTEHNEPTGKSVLRDQAHAEGLWHRTVHIYVTRETGLETEVLVHVRAKNKKQYPGRYDPVFGGHIQAGGTGESAALSEIAEEIGILPDKAKLKLHGFIQKDDELKAPGDKEFNMIFSYVLSNDEFEQLHLQKDEIESAHWMLLSDLPRIVAESEESWRPSHDEVCSSLEVLLGSKHPLPPLSH